VRATLEKSEFRVSAPNISRRSGSAALNHPSIQAMFSQKPLSREEELRLVILYQDHGDLEARQKLVRHNLRFVFRVTLRFLPVTHDDFWDYFGEGVAGLIRGIDMYNRNTKNKLLSYCVWWIMQSIHFAISTTGSIKITVPTAQKFLRDNPDIDEDMGGKKVGIHKKVNKVRLLMTPKSMSATVPGTDLTYGDYVDAQQARESEEYSMHNEFASDKDLLLKHQVALLEEVLEQLPPRYALVVRRRYLSGDELTTYDEIAQELGCSKERVRQLLFQGLQKAKTLIRMKNITKNEVF
jgi:RNA polymerase sigma factor (sigma-70 family)